MTIKALAFVLLLGAGCPAAFAQNPAAQPFAGFDQELRKQQGGFAGDKSQLSGSFNAERQRLGKQFEPELLKYLGDDAEKHYWLSLFVTAPTYLHGNEPLPHLGLLMMEQGLSLLRSKTDADAHSRTVSLNVIAAVQSEQLGFRALASAHKDMAEELTNKDEDLRGSFPAMSETEIRLYDAIKSRYQTNHAPMRAKGEPRARVSAGILNGRAVKLPAPAYPNEPLRVDGEVKVKIVVDESGKVIWAEAVEGHPLLRAASVQAAMQAEFKPLLLSGKAVTFGGFLIYKFLKGR